MGASSERVASGFRVGSRALPTPKGREGNSAPQTELAGNARQIFVPPLSHSQKSEQVAWTTAYSLPDHRATAICLGPCAGTTSGGRRMWVSTSVWVPASAVSGSTSEHANGARTRSLRSDQLRPVPRMMRHHINERDSIHGHRMYKVVLHFRLCVASNHMNY